MFGYITASRQQLPDESWQRYSALYCGLCRELGVRCGNISRLTLTYDMTFLIIILSGIFESSEESGFLRCAVHPLKRRNYIRTEYTAYAADMNILLAYHNMLDDWLLSLTGAKVFAGRVRGISEHYRRQDEAVRTALSELAELEKRGENNPDLPAASFGRLMAELFVPEESEKSPELRRFGYTLGRLIYIMDACVDFENDIKKEKYNPLTACQKSDFEPMLEMLCSECAEAFEVLGCERDRELIQNILYCGLWSNYARKYGKTNEKGGAAK